MVLGTIRMLDTHDRPREHLHMIRLGLIGCGRWGRNYVQAAHEAGNCAVTHVAGATWPHGVEAVASTDWRRLQNARVDAFIVATPPSTHAEICTELLALGRPVMVEKPMALGVLDAVAIADAAIASGAPLLVNHQHLFAPAYEELRERSSGWSSRVVVSAAGGRGPVRDYSALWDYGAHDVAMFLGLTRTRRSARVFADRRGGNFRVTLGTKDESGFLRVWNDAEPKARTLTVMRGSESLTYDDLDPLGAKLRHDGRPIPVAPDKPLTRAVRAFADVCAGKPRDWRFDPFFGVDVTRILSQAEATMEERDGDDS